MDEVLAGLAVLTSGAQGRQLDRPAAGCHQEHRFAAHAVLVAPQFAEPGHELVESDWVVNQAVTLIGGGIACLRTKPLMIGVIAGDLLAGLIRMVVSTVYYLITGHASPA